MFHLRRGMSHAELFFHANQDELGDDTVFEDLGLSQKEYPKLQTTW